MTKVYLLLGAGFSRNWGGWLANEVFEYLLGSQEIISDSAAKHWLWSYKDRGGFEATLAHFQAEHATQGGPPSQSLGKLQDAITGMFNDMNSAFDSAVFEFNSKPAHGTRITDFLSRFDAIFTLNQDLLLERHYLPASGAKSGCYLPGITEIATANNNGLIDRRWSVGETMILQEGMQPIFKLHGSSNWTDSNNSRLLIMGGNKNQTINKSKLLRDYSNFFDTALAEPAAGLMTIGYGFRDDHVTNLIRKNLKNGLRLFIVDPLGTDVYDRMLGAPIRDRSGCKDLDAAIVGASRRSLRDIFGADTIEYGKLMRFFL